ncbi:hypothetical protein FB107DRAFT_258795, partial [Schizophyllum commune]
MDNLAPLVAGIVVARALYPHLSIWTRGSLPDERALEDASEGDDNAGKDQWRPRAWAQRVAKGAEECIVLDDHTAPVWEIAYKATLLTWSAGQMYLRFSASVLVPPNQFYDFAFTNVSRVASLGLLCFVSLGAALGWIACLTRNRHCVRGHSIIYILFMDMLFSYSMLAKYGPARLSWLTSLLYDSYSATLIKEGTLNTVSRLSFLLLLPPLLTQAYRICATPPHAASDAHRDEPLQPKTPAEVTRQHVLTAPAPEETQTEEPADTRPLIDLPSHCEELLVPPNETPLDETCLAERCTEDREVAVRPAQQTSGLSACPQEIINEICEFLSTKDLLAITTTCTRFHTASIHPLYRSIHLSNALQAIKFFRTINNRPDAAVAVRYLMPDRCVFLNIKGSRSSTFFRLAASAINRMINVRQLALHHAVLLPSLLSHTPFQDLRSCYIHLTVDTAAFLANQRRLEVLVITDCCVDEIGAVPRNELIKQFWRLPAACFARLEVYSAPSFLILPVLPRACVKHLPIKWSPPLEAPDTHVQDVYLCLAASKTPLKILHNFSSYDDFELQLSALVAHPPRVEYLLWFEFTGRFLRPLNDIYQKVEDVLHALPTIKELRITGVGRPLITEAVGLVLLDLEHDTVASYKKQCPKLSSCILA